MEEGCGGGGGGQYFGQSFAMRRCFIQERTCLFCDRGGSILHYFDRPGLITCMCTAVLDNVVVKSSQLFF